MSKKFPGRLLAAVLCLALCAAATAETAWNDGTYTGTAAGKMGDVTCEVAVEGGKIASVTVTAQSESVAEVPAVAQAIEEIPAKITEAQSTEVEAVAGATVTSDAIRTAVDNALTLAAGGTVTEQPDVAKGRLVLGTPAEGEESYPGENVIKGMQAQAEANVAKHAPKVITLDNGIKIQRTPSEYDTGGYTQFASTMAYNTQYLNADKRGCKACHEDLAETLRNMDGCLHVDLTNDLGLDLDINACIDCHSYSPGYVLEYYQLGTLLHNIHTASNGFDGDCWSCHNATADGQGLTLWDNVKYDILRGIYDTDADTLQAEFSYDQSLKTETEDFYNYYWLYYDNDYTRFAAGFSGNNTGDPDIFNSWTITLTGYVNQEVTYTLAELIEQAPSETFYATMQCTINPTGGPLISGVEVTAIPYSWLLEQAGGYTEEAAGMLPTGTDGFTTPAPWEHLNEEGAGGWLIYKINGEYLNISDGFPCTFWTVGGSGGNMTKQLSTLQVIDAEELAGWHTYEGWLTEAGWEDGTGYYNKPNLGIYHKDYSGIVLGQGEEYTLTGYAAAWDQQITAVEISLDRGKTWTTYETPVNNYLAVTWSYKFTAPTAPGAYVIYARAVEGDGLKTQDIQKFMFNVQ